MESQMGVFSSSASLLLLLLVVSIFLARVYLGTVCPFGFVLFGEVVRGEVLPAGQL